MGKSTNLEVIRKVGELTDNIELMAKDAKKELKYIDSVLLRYASFYNKKSKQNLRGDIFAPFLYSKKTKLIISTKKECHVH